VRVLLRGDRPLSGTVRPGGDKSISHRVLMLGAMAEGQTTIEGLNEGADVRSTMACLAALGVKITEGDQVVVEGRAGELRCPTGVLDCGNSGTTMRLMAGLVATQPFTCTLDGDSSLSARPMRRVATPLRGMGVRVEGPDNASHPPLIVTGPVRRGGSFSIPVASAQVKSAALLAGACAGKRVRIEEPGASRDHTEHLLNAFGIACEHGEGFALVDPDPGQILQGRALKVPGDPSAAALLAACALAVPGSKVEITDTLLNPRRTGFVEVLRRMGCAVDVVIQGSDAGEDFGTLSFGSGELTSTTVLAKEVPSLIDEVPALTVVAAVSRGTTVFEGVRELRTKESDRLASLVQLLDAFSISAHADEDRLEVVGASPRLRADLPPSDDHRILMASAGLLLAARAGGQESLPQLDAAAVGISDPHFFASLGELDAVAGN